MPHRVASFFRNSTENLATTASAIKTAARRRDSNSRPRNPDRAFSYASSLSDEGEEGNLAVRMPATTETTVLSQQRSHNPIYLQQQQQQQQQRQPTPPAPTGGIKKHRLLPFGRSSRENHESGSACLSWKVESPPIVFYGDAETSTGALVSGQLFLTVKEDWLEVDAFEATLNVHVVQKRPFQSHCTECANQYTELKKWTFLTHPTTLPRGQHQYPISVLLGGHLPASVDTPLVSITYEFKAEAITARSPSTPTGSCVPVRLDEVFDVQRSLSKPDVPHHSVRVFPPTNVKATAHYEQVVYPSSSQTLSLRLDGLVTTNTTNKTLEIWKLKKIGWRLEENIKTIAPACDKHSPAAAAGDATPLPKKGIQRSETRGLGEKNMFDGWKANYSAKDGTVEMEFDYGVHLHRLLGHGSSSGHKYACDSRSQDGTEVSHTLMVEMVVSREWAPIGKPHMTTQTGTGRILRMHYHVALSELSGLGVSWDNEAPPLYQDVPPSPPTYPEECPIDYDSLEPLEARRSGSQEPR